MVREKFYATDQTTDYAGVNLAGEPLSVIPPTRSPNQKKALPYSKRKNFELKSRFRNLRIRSSSKQSPIYVKKEPEKMKKNVFGYELIMDLSGCDLKVMSSKVKLTEYVNKLCKLIKMEKYGKTHLPYFGVEKPFTKGFSLLQFIETSSITGHFSEYWCKSDINIISCKKYSHKLAKEFTKEFFKAKNIKTKFLIR